MRSNPPIAEKLWKQVPAAVQVVIMELLRSLWEKVERLTKKTNDLQDTLDQARRQSREQEQKIQELQRTVDELKERVNKNSTNSSKPPSSDGPQVKRSPPKPRGKRKRGGQPGRPKAERKLIPSEQCQEVIVVKPDACEHCGVPLDGEDPDPRRHQVWELPEVKPEVTEHQLHTLGCSCCGKTTTAGLPTDVPQGSFGPRLVSLVALLIGVYRLSKRQVRQICEDLWGVPISLGQVCRLQNLSRQALEPAAEQARQHVQTEPANVDETRWVEDKTRCCLWVAVTECVAAFFIRATRGAKELHEILGRRCEQVVTSDRAKAYDTLPLSRRQLCWSHLCRDFQAMIDRGNSGAKIGQELLWLAQAMLGNWAKVREGRRTRRWFQAVMEDFRHDVRVTLERGTRCRCAKTAATCRELLDREEALWTFAHVEGVEPTNNDGERELRPAVQFRKSSFGTDSTSGSRFLENIFTVAGSLRRQNRNIWQFLTACHQAYFQGQSPPSILPSDPEADLSQAAA